MKLKRQHQKIVNYSTNSKKMKLFSALMLFGLIGAPVMAHGNHHSHHKIKYRHNHCHIHGKKAIHHCHKHGGKHHGLYHYGGKHEYKPHYYRKGHWRHHHLVPFLHIDIH
tara:strand:- start:387 stop:716 length:330 start_codon:yes stop_codon:yes gene_type:complete